MKIFIGADHRGYQLKKSIAAQLTKQGHAIVDVGTQTSGTSCDYPQFSYAVARNVSQTPHSRGILICMTGIGHSIAANKVRGAYAALCYNKRAAVLSREHNNSNILVLGAKFVRRQDMMGIITAWLKTPADGGRHARRVSQIKRIECKTMKNGKGKRKKKRKGDSHLFRGQVGSREI